MKNDKKRSQKLSIYLHKKEINGFDNCIKEKALINSTVHQVKQGIGMQGKVYIHETVTNIPEWKEVISKITNEKVDISANAANKAVVVFWHKKRYFSVVYGYGRSMLADSTIERNFGLIVAANLISPKKLKSLNSMTIEDTIVDTQKQSISYSSQDDFQINQNKEILKSVSGSPNLESTASFLVGTDSLTATRKMNINNIKESIDFYYKAFKRKDYIKNGFKWLDNIKRVKDKTKVESLNEKLVMDIQSTISSVVIGPNRIVDWENIVGFYFSGLGKVKEENINISLDYETYIKKLKNTKVNILDKLKRDTIKAKTDHESDFIVSKVYDGIIFETFFESSKYLLCYGDWYEIDKEFYKDIKEKISSCPICELSLPKCKNKESEGDYNLRISESDDEYALLDKKNYSIPGYGRSSVEPCDILTRDKQLIHIKKGGSSSTLSHLFSQGTVSARIISSDKDMRRHINKNVKAKFGSRFLKMSDINSDYEVVYAIIDHRNEPLFDILPFFSLVNLSHAIDQLSSMNFKYSIMKIGVKDS